MRKPPFWPTALTLLCVLILCALGSWQIKRLHWKQGLLARLAAIEQQADVPLFSTRDIAASPEDFTAARLRGHFGAHEILLGIRTWEGQVGYHILAPFILDDGGVVLVNRGWIPLAKKDPASRPASAAPAGAISISGILHRPGRDNPFVPPNDPKAAQWYRWDLPAMAAALDTKTLAPMVLYVKTASDENADSLPVTAALKWTLPNNHLYYACFWFTMAGVMLIIYALRFLKSS